MRKKVSTYKVRYRKAGSSKHFTRKVRAKTAAQAKSKVRKGRKLMFSYVNKLSK